MLPFEVRCLLNSLVVSVMDLGFKSLPEHENIDKFLPLASMCVYNVHVHSRRYTVCIKNVCKEFIIGLLIKIKTNYVQIVCVPKVITVSLLR